MYSPTWRIVPFLEMCRLITATIRHLFLNSSPTSGHSSIFNTDLGSQFTSWAWIQRLKDAGIRISMDGRGRFLDNIFIERLWRSLKYECVYLHAFSGGREARRGVGDLMTFYNHRRPHAVHGAKPPGEVYLEWLSASGPGLRPALQPTALVA
jgi:putative transposase